MRGKWGRIVNIGSVSALVGNAGQSNYAASKAALIGFTRSIAKEMARKGITANVVAPGFIQTDMTEALPQRVQAHAVGLTPPLELLQTGQLRRVRGDDDLPAEVVGNLRRIAEPMQRGPAAPAGLRPLPAGAGVGGGGAVGA